VLSGFLVIRSFFIAYLIIENEVIIISYFFSAFLKTILKLKEIDFYVIYIKNFFFFYMYFRIVDNAIIVQISLVEETFLFSLFFRKFLVFFFTQGIQLSEIVFFIRIQLSKVVFAGWFRTFIILFLFLVYDWWIKVCGWKVNFVE
jgi:hypothetical protein